MAEGLFSPLGFQTPEELRAGISKKYQEMEKARYERAAQNFAQAGSHAGRMGALGQQLGMTLRGALSDPKGPDWNLHPEVQQAQVRQDTIKSIDLNDPVQVAAAASQAMEGEDVQFGTWLYDRANRLQQQRDNLNLERAKLDAAAGKQKWKYKHWSEGNRKVHTNSLQNVDYIKDISNEEIRSQASSAIIGGAESLWNYKRELGDDDYTMTEAVNDVTDFGSNYFVKNWWEDSFDVKAFNAGLSDAFGMKGRPAPKKTAAPKKERPKAERPAAAVEESGKVTAIDPSNLPIVRMLREAKARSAAAETDFDDYEIDF